MADELTITGLQARGIAKRFGGTVALGGVDFSVSAGEIVGLMGANGAGKSTLVNILCGVLPADSGSLTLNGRPYQPASPRDALQMGVVAIHQATDRAGMPGLSVAEALVLDQLADGRSGFFTSQASIRLQAARVAANAGFDLALEADFGDIGPAERQLVAIARALSANAQVLILDEPTASLSATEAGRLFGILERLAGDGLAIVYISHRTADLVRLAHRTVVLRGGRVAAEFFRPFAIDAALEAMIGRPLALARPLARSSTGPARLVAQDIRLHPRSVPWDLTVHAGEVVAIAGPLGAGKSRFLLSLFGASGISGGTVRLDGAAWKPANPADAIAQGVFLAGEDRRRTSLLPKDWPGGTVSGTISLPHLKRWFPSGFLRPSAERDAATHAIAALGITAGGPDAPLSTLSGGNQQKVVLGRWLAERPRLLLLDEPFQGVDVGARADIAAALRGLDDVAVLVATSDLEEAFEAADRIFILDDRGLLPVSGPADAAAFCLDELTQ